jgi:UDP-N-acetylmuramoyl-tripeptide--D-alanyl-D-alanine ligase
MGINHPGEMDVLADIARPDLALVTNIGTAHVGLMGSREAIAREKIRIARHFDGSQAAFLPEADCFFDLMAGSVNGKVVAFGPRTTRGFEGSQDLGLDGTLVHWEGLRIRFPLFGAFNLLNALGALSVSAELGVSKSAVQEGLESTEPLFGRSQILRGEVTVIHDGYNANPEAVERLIDFVEAVPWSGRKLVVLGSMKELGAESEEAHRAVGRRAARSGVDALLFFGEEMRSAYEEFQSRSFDGPAISAHGPGAEQEQTGLGAPRRAEAFWTTAFEELEARVKQGVASGDLIVLKGSRAMQLERLLSCLPVPSGSRFEEVGVKTWC